jgi:hypothetical protein
MFERDRAWCVDATPEAIDIPAMAEAAAKLVGTHDFSSFRALECSGTPLSVNCPPNLSRVLYILPYLLLLVFIVFF